MANSPLCGVNFYMYSVSGDNLLLVIRGSGVSTMEGLLDFYGETIVLQHAICPYIAMSTIEGCQLRGVSLYIECIQQRYQMTKFYKSIRMWECILYCLD